MVDAVSTHLQSADKFLRSRVHAYLTFIAIVFVDPFRRSILSSLLTGTAFDSGTMSSHVLSGLCRATIQAFPILALFHKVKFEFCSGGIALLLRSASRLILSTVQEHPNRSGEISILRSFFDSILGLS